MTLSPPSVRAVALTAVVWSLAYSTVDAAAVDQEAAPPPSLAEDVLLRVTTGPLRIKGALPPGTPVAHKTGTSETRDGKTDATNDVGLVTLPNGTRVALAVFVHASPADVATRERTIARLARVAYDAFSGSARVMPTGGANAQE